MCTIIIYIYRYTSVCSAMSTGWCCLLLKLSLPKDFPYQRSLNYIGQVEQHDGDMIQVQILHCFFLVFIVTDIQLCSPCQLRCAPACGFDHFWLRWNLATWRWHQNILYLDVHPSYNGGMKGVRITMVVPQLFGIGPTCSIGSIGLTLPNLAMQAVAVWIYSCSMLQQSP